MARDDYLWDGSGEPDPETRRLEDLLGRFRHAGPAPDVDELSARRAGGPGPAGGGGRLPVWWPALAVAALVVVLAGGAAWIAAHRGGLSGTAWEIAGVEGTAHLAGVPAASGGRLPVGAWLTTDPGARVTLEASGLGQIRVEPGTRLQLVEAAPAGHRLALEQGTIQAWISAPPRIFLVDTPSATAVDLGCAYVLQVDEDGAGHLRVTSGWVAFEWEGIESYVPEGARCSTRPDAGPGIPYYEDAPATLRSALAALEGPTGDEAARAAALRTAMAASRSRDRLSLWHLLARARAEERGSLFDRMEALGPVPDGVTREGIEAGDKEMLSLWADDLQIRGGFWRREWRKAIDRVR